ncbi:IQ and AAA domain-containing protein 1-like [Trichoplusia ni]|uniref:IQ and AAA domain-containing protein 1-like n=1 Tax=Trichoplusia ni TaxID=7111 RepID=A0A7E5W2W0_TRINI|nr:IQ and AAA domain-containing protein 1-like [Trichoplusia ni]
MPLTLPDHMNGPIEAHQNWLRILEQAQNTVEEDLDLQRATAKGMKLRERALPPELLGRNYARYCDLINKMYDAYLSSVHLQRAPYILDLITVLMKRLYELRHELIHLIVNDYIYVDAALTQLRVTPMDIEIVVPYHFPLETREDNVEQVIQKMWADAVRRKKIRERPKPPPPPPKPSASPWDTDSIERVPEVVEPPPAPVVEEVEDIVSEPPSVHTYVPEEFIQAVLIQRHERYRQWFMLDFKEKARQWKTFYGTKNDETPVELKHRAARIIQRTYRELMKLKREKVREIKRDVLLGIIPDPFRTSTSYREATNKVYDRRRNTRFKIKQTYLKELERENTRLIVFKKGEQIDDITDEIREWFKEWYYGYGFFPEYPYDIEGGTIMVVRGDYPTVEEKIADDERMETMMKGKTREQLKQEQAAAKADAKNKAAALKEAKQKEEATLMKARCNPFSDPGYAILESETLKQVVEAFNLYRVSWSLYDELPSEEFGETVYGYMKPLLIEEIMSTMHKECRVFVDELMRLDLKMLIQKHQLTYKRIGMKYPKLKPRKKPKIHPLPKPVVMDDKLMKGLEDIFDIGIVTKPTVKISDVYGDLNYAAYEKNIQDPNATFPLASYGDVKTRLVLSCVLGCGIQPGAVKHRSVMLLGPDRNGKSFLADTVAGELNAVKIDITPERFTAVIDKPLRALTHVFLAAKAFQPTVVFMKNVERVFSKKVLPEEKYLQAKVIKAALIKLVKQIAPEDKIIFIATCTHPYTAQAKPMVRMFDEILLVPRTDYGSLHLFFAEKFNSLRSMPLDYPTQPIAQLTQGYGFGAIIEAYHEVMTPERIIRLNVDPLSPGEFLEVLFAKDIEPLSKEEYQPYVDFFLASTSLKQLREDYARINYFREDAYKKMAKKNAKQKGHEESS